MTSRSAPCRPASPLALGLATALALATLLVALPASATTYVMATDQHMVETADAVVQARVLSVDSAPATGMPATDYMIEVERVLSGEVTGRNLIVRLPGGVRPDGVGLKLFGVPEMIVGERVVLFLTPSRSAGSAGTWSIHHFMLGAFHEVLHEGQRLLVRDLTGAHELVMPGEEPGVRSRFHRARKAEEFTRWIEQVGRGREVKADYFFKDPSVSGSAGPGSITGQFRLFRGDSNNLFIRWFEFERGQNVAWHMQAGGQPGIGPSDTARALRGGMAAWNNDGGSNVDYRYVGTTTSTQGFDGCPGSGSRDCRDTINAVIFANADGSIASPFSCFGGGGTLALGGPWFIGTNTGPQGELYNIISEAEIITNEGIECFLEQQDDPVRALEQLLGHELGHTLGIDHPCTTGEADRGQCPAPQNDALMYPYLHEDGRAAVLNSDDRNAVRRLYPGSSNVPGPAAPSGLEGVVLSSSEIQLTWNDNADDETSYIVQIRPAAGNFSDLVTLPANTTEFLVEDLEPLSLYAFRVRGRNANGNSAYSNVIELETFSAIPAAPQNLEAVVGSQDSVNLTWTDASDNETDFVVEARNATGGSWNVVREGVVASALDPTVSTSITGLPSGMPQSFRVRARNEIGISEASNVAAATPPSVSLGSCAEEDGAICLLDGRFRVSVTWRNQYAENEFGTGQGARFPGSDRTGTFWFFQPDNKELIIKVLDGTSINDFYWTFYGALSDVEYWVTVLDTIEGASRTYYNPPGEQCGRADAASIPEDDVLTDPVAATAATVDRAPLPVDRIADAVEGTCTPGEHTLCLLDDRFAVSVDWVDERNDRSGQGVAVPDVDSEKTGYFWFFNETNIELVTKALDGGPVNGNLWFFYGALSDVQYTITVVDTVTGQQKAYTNETGNYCGQFDTAAFVPEG